MLEDSDEEIGNVGVREIYISPPEVTELTDEDSGEEDEGGFVDNLNRKQLLAPAEVVFENNYRISEAPVHPIENDKQPTLSIKANLKFDWMDGDIIDNKPEPAAPNYTQFCNKSVVDIFEMFLDDDIINFLAEESNKYAGFINCPSPNITEDEIRCFVAILYLTGYVVLPGKRFYWDTGADMHNKLVSDTMRRDRFIQIMRFIHCADNTQLDKKDKMAKLRPFIQKLKKNFLNYFVPTQNLDYDEAMVKYYGRHPCKQYIKGKPIRFGYKVWSLNTDFGYLVNFDIYQGSNPNKNDSYNFEFGACAAPLVKMIDELPNQTFRHNIYFDNLFTGLPLLYHLKERGYGATGTIRENRLPKTCPIIDKKSAKKWKEEHMFRKCVEKLAFQ
ncbi:piggyBac transposable element-derived protein 3-like [Anoplophora glabripennis]|uniref:piggyBac transposable element-derived protein 3-like n=1 Tax=Anoplophora glabripennis TaxID=217634 RepID=UPI00087590D0|nr:piggyBac transposable element-derived protein 3-like [Anoplophora glabripennis]